MANSYVFYPSETGARTDYSVPYEYLSQTFVKATVNGASVPFTFLSTYMIRFTTAPVGALKIYRETSKAPVNTYINGSILVDSQLNGSFIQSLHVSEEVSDNAMVTALDGAWDAQNLKIKNVADPTQPQDVVNKRWAEAVGSGFVGTAGASAAAAAASAAAALADKNTVAADKAIVASDKATVLGYRNEVEADRAEVATNKATVATDKGIVAADKATVASDKAAAATSATNAATSATNASNSASSASNSASSASTSATNAATSKTGADTAKTGADAAKTAAETARDLAQNWASGAEDVVVSGGLYSAYHWARKALGYVTGSIANAIHGATAKTTPVDADEFAIADSAASWGLKKLSWANIRTALQVAAGFRLGPQQPVGTLDPNTITETGWFTAINTSPNIPVANHGYIESYVSANGAVGSKGNLQRWTSVSDFTEYMRNRWFSAGDTWNAWVQTRNADGTLADITFPARLRDGKATGLPLLTDANSADTSGWHRCTNSAANIPVADYSVIKTTVFDANWMIQELQTNAADLRYVRIRKGGVWGSWSQVDSSIKSSAMINIGAGAAVYDVTGIPSWAKRITVTLLSVSFNGFGELGIQGGTSGGIATSGYNGTRQSGGAALGTATLTSMIGTSYSTAGDSVHGTVILTRLAGSLSWEFNAHVTTTVAQNISTAIGSLTLGAALDRIRLTAGGIATGDAGWMMVHWE